MDRLCFVDMMIFLLTQKIASVHQTLLIKLMVPIRAQWIALVMMRVSTKCVQFFVLKWDKFSLRRSFMA